MPSLDLALTTVRAPDAVPRAADATSSTGTVLGDFLSVALTISVALGAIMGLLALLVWLEQGISADSADTRAAEDGQRQEVVSSGSTSRSSS